MAAESHSKMLKVVKTPLALQPPWPSNQNTACTIALSILKFPYGIWRAASASMRNSERLVTCVFERHLQFCIDESVCAALLEQFNRYLPSRSFLSCRREVVHLGRKDLKTFLNRSGKNLKDHKRAHHECLFCQTATDEKPHTRAFKRLARPHKKAP